MWPMWPMWKEKQVIKNDFKQLKKDYKVISKSNAKYAKKEQKDIG